MPKISIVMPVFNGAEWLQRAIDSIRHQSLRDFEFIIIDDGSTDHSRSIGAQAAYDDNRIQMVDRTHLGVAAALNGGIALARASLIARMDADDIASPNRLERQFSFLDANPDIAALGSWARVIDEKDHEIGELKPEERPDALRGVLAKTNPFIHSSMVMSTDLVRLLGGYRPALEGAEDYDLWLRMSEAARLANLPEFLMSCRRHSGSVSVVTAKRQLLMARLARMSALARQEGRRDFIEDADGPISLGFLRDRSDLRSTAQFYALLSRSPENPLQGQDLNVLAQAGFNHAERKAAQQWLTGRLTSKDSWLTRARALFWLLYLHPPRGFSLIWAAIRARRSA